MFAQQKHLLKPSKHIHSVHSVMMCCNVYFGWVERIWERAEPQDDKFTFNFNYSDAFPEISNSRRFFSFVDSTTTVVSSSFFFFYLTSMLKRRLELYFPHLNIKYQQLNHGSQHSTRQMLQIKMVLFFLSFFTLRTKNMAELKIESDRKRKLKLA